MDLRWWWKPDSGEMTRTRKGVQLPVQTLKKLITMRASLINDFQVLQEELNQINEELNQIFNKSE